MRQTHVIGLGKEWWKDTRAPASGVVQVVDHSKPIRASKVYHTVQQVADRFQVSFDVVYELIGSGQLNAIKFGRCWRIPEEALSEYLGRSRTG
jgi:excisionase family DNA binding protein